MSHCGISLHAGEAPSCARPSWRITGELWRFCDSVLESGGAHLGATSHTDATQAARIGVVVFASPAAPQTPDSLPSQNVLKKLTLEELMAIEVSSVSRRPERLSEAASAIQVITREDIRRSGATRLPEALRLAGNLEVTQFDAAQWAISARGFNSPLANKLLVLIDGRSVCSPLFAGVFWDAQDVLLEDIEQIEVISGPGATLWAPTRSTG
jgi:iron complex outermembrane recepter protein